MNDVQSISAQCWGSVQSSRPEHWLTGDNIQAIVITAFICLAACYCFWVVSHSELVVIDKDDDDSGNREDS